MTDRTDRTALIAGIIAEPKDDARWLIFADYLHERGEHELLEEAIRHFILGRKFRECQRVEQGLLNHRCSSVAATLTYGPLEHLKYMKYRGCDPCSHFASSRLLEYELRDLLENLV